LQRTIAPPILLKGKRDTDLEIVQEFANFWKIPFVTVPPSDGNQILVSSGMIPASDAETSRVVVIFPAGIQDARVIAEEFDLAVRSREALIRLPVGPSAFVSMRTILYEFSGPNLEPVVRDDDTTIMSRVRDTSVYLSALDLASEYERLISRGLDEVPSRKFRLITRFPFSYRAIPSFIRNRAFKAPRGSLELSEDKLFPVECLRVIFLASLVVAAGQGVPRLGFWRKGKSHALAVTHDVETRLGLEDGASRLAQVESKLGIRSTWNIPSDRYPLSSQLLVTLAGAGEIGGHDTKHDGALIFEKFDNKVKRVGKCRARLESLSDSEIRGFRSPLLQHSRELLYALSKAGFEYDSSAPSWEPLSPTSLRPHGVGTVFPFQVSGMLEIPVSLPQDHQLIRVVGLTVSEAVQELLRVSARIREIGGICVLLIHPDYEFGDQENSEEYYRLLEGFRSDPECEVLTLGELSRWWTHREKAHIESSNGNLTIRYGDSGHADDLELEIVTGYGQEGFTVANPSPAEIETSSRERIKGEELA
jgi:hypothetical protein